VESNGSGEYIARISKSKYVSTEDPIKPA
jgi:hypothetical protein